METTGYILAAITLIWIWETQKKDWLFKKVDEIRFEPRNKVCEYLADNKPFNCATCLSFWFGLLLFLYFDFNIFYLSLPIFNHLTTKVL